MAVRARHDRGAGPGTGADSGPVAR